MSGLDVCRRCWCRVETGRNGKPKPHSCHHGQPCRAAPAPGWPDKAACSWCVDEAATRAAWTTTLRGGALPMLLGVGAWTVKPGASTLGDERTAKARCAHKGCGKALLVKPGSAGHPCCDNCFEKHHRAKFEAEGAALQAAIDEDRA